MTGTHPAILGRRRGPLRVGVVVPVFNEAGVLPQLHRRTAAALRGAGHEYEIVFVNDGSRDGSADLLDRLAEADPGVVVVHLARNFGHQAAVQAGLVHASGDVVVVMDADLQDDPDRIPDLIAPWREGYDIVYAVRACRKEGPLKRLLFNSFYRILGMVATIPIPRDAGNFSLLDGRVAQVIAELPDRDRYLPGLRSWVGFRQIGVTVERGARYDGQPRVSLAGLFRLAKTALFSFSNFPLTFFYLVSALAMVGCLALTGFALYHKLHTGQAIPGWTSLLTTCSFFGSLNALGIAILGEYVLRIYDQVRARPQFLVARTQRGSAPQERQGGPPFPRDLARSA